MPPMNKNVLLISTSASSAEWKQKTGVWLEELAAPYYIFKEAGYTPTIASVMGGKPPIDESSLSDERQTEYTRRFLSDDEAQRMFANTPSIESLLPQIQSRRFSCIYLAGGHGAVIDFVDNASLTKAIEDIYGMGGVVSAVCHGVVGLTGAKEGTEKRPLLHGKRVTGFSQREEQLVGLAEKIQSVEKLLQQSGIGSLYSCAEPWSSHVEQDGRIVTGQNPASSALVARDAIRVLEANA